MPMLKSGGGRDLMIRRNDLTQRYDFSWDSTSNPGFDDSATHLVLTAILEYRNQWWARAAHGSRLHLIKQDNSETKSGIERSVSEALQPFVESKQLKRFTVSATRLYPGRYDIQVLWETTANIPGALLLPITY